MRLKPICMFFIAFTCSSSAFATTISISSCQELQDISSAHGVYEIVNDIDCAGFDFNPIEVDFRGVLDGQGHTISNLSIENPVSPQPHLVSGGGLFFSIEDAQIHDIHFDNAKLIYSDLNYERGLIAGTAMCSEISGITVNTLDITGDTDEALTCNAYKTGGLFGIMRGGSIQNSVLNNINIAFKNYAGGLVGMTYRPHGDGPDFFGLIHRTSVRNLTIIPVKSDDSSSGNSLYGNGVGGLVGSFNDATITESMAQGTIGSKDAEIQAYGGGLIGFMGSDYFTLTIRNSYSDVEIFSKSYGAGLIGYTVHEQESPVVLENVFATGRVNVDESDGGRGIVGNCNNTSSRVKSTEGYFDTDTTSRENSGDSGSIGLSTQDMQNSGTYSTWDRGIWDIADGRYPKLQHEALYSY